MMAEALDPFVVLPLQNIDDVVHSEPLTGAVDAGEGFLGRLGAVPGRDRLEAGVAISARLLQLVAEVRPGGSVFCTW